jgi:drug/metabolite transporter (DMT)-like permease
LNTIQKKYIPTPSLTVTLHRKTLKHFDLLYLIGSIILTSYLTLSFKALERFRIPAFQAITFNYITCVVTGSIVNRGFPADQITGGEPWLVWAMIMGCFFIGLFNVIAFTAQKVGIAVASVANKLSLVIPFIFSIILYQETTGWLRVAGILLALVSVVLTCYPTKKDPATTGRSLSPALKIFLPVLLFIGSGLLDTMVKYVEQTYLNASNQKPERLPDLLFCYGRVSGKSAPPCARSFRQAKIRQA